MKIMELQKLYIKAHCVECLCNIIIVVVSMLLLIRGFSGLRVDYLNTWYTKWEEGYLFYPKPLVITVDAENGNADDLYQKNYEEYQKIVQHIIENSSNENVSYFYRALSEKFLLRKNTLFLTCCKENDEISADVLRKGRIFSDSPYECIQVHGNHKVGEFINVEYFGQEQKFEIIGDMQYSILPTASEDIYQDFSGFNREVYIVNPKRYDVGEYYSDEVYSVYIKPYLELDEKLYNELSVYGVIRPFSEIRQEEFPNDRSANMYIILGLTFLLLFRILEDSYLFIHRRILYRSLCCGSRRKLVICFAWRNLWTIPVGGVIVMFENLFSKVPLIDSYTVGETGVFVFFIFMVESFLLSLLFNRRSVVDWERKQGVDSNL